MVLIEIEPCAAETMRVIGMAERYVKKNKIQKGQIWCVYDKDSFFCILHIIHRIIAGWNIFLF